MRSINPTLLSSMDLRAPAKHSLPNKSISYYMVEACICAPLSASKTSSLKTSRTQLSCVDGRITLQRIVQTNSVLDRIISPLLTVLSKRNYYQLVTNADRNQIPLNYIAFGAILYETAPMRRLRPKRSDPPWFVPTLTTSYMKPIITEQRLTGI